MRALISALLLTVACAAVGEVIYVTDVEGSRVKLEAAFLKSGAFDRGVDGFWTLKPGKRFVYGGDAPDRFYGSMWVVEQLARLLEQSPDAKAILGNRDGNKPRLTGELLASARTEATPWFAWTLARDLVPAIPASAPERLKWILSPSMGSPKAFELRGKELAAADRPPWVEPLRKALSAQLHRDVPYDDDAMIVESYLYELGPTGAMTRLLRRSQLTFRDGKTLYLHGGISQWNFGRVPGRVDRIRSLPDWQAALEHWYQGLLQRWEANRESIAGDGRRAVEELNAYMMPVPGTRSNRRSVVTGRTGTAGNMPWLPPPWVIEELKAQGIHRLVLGHTPSGDAPTFVRSADGSFEVICADNSYGLREDAATILRVGEDSVKVETSYRVDGGTMRPLDFTAKLGEQSPLGMYLGPDELVVAIDGDDAIVYRMANFQVSYRRVPVAMLKAESLREAIPAAVSGGVGVVQGLFDPPTLADRSRAAMLLESLGLEKLRLVVLADSSETYASQLNRAEMLRRMSAAMPPDIEVIVVRTPADIEAAHEGAVPLTDAWAKLTLPESWRGTSAEDARALVSTNQRPDFIHPDVWSWIRMHGLYRPMAPRPFCPQFLIESTER